MNGGAMRAMCRPGTWSTRWGRRLRCPDGPGPPGGDRWTRSDVEGVSERQRDGRGRQLVCPTPNDDYVLGLVYVSRSGRSGSHRLEGGVEPVKLPPGPYPTSLAVSERPADRVAGDDGKEASVWIYDWAARHRCGGSHSEAKTGFRSGRRTASRSPSNRIARETSVSSGSARTAPGRR